MVAKEKDHNRDLRDEEREREKEREREREGQNRGVEYSCSMALPVREFAYFLSESDASEPTATRVFSYRD